MKRLSVDTSTRRREKQEEEPLTVADKVCYYTHATWQGMSCQDEATRAMARPTRLGQARQEMAGFVRVGRGMAR
jgi:hypothetical protein